MASSRILVNTLAAYSRSVIAAGLALFSSRWVLHSLGAIDYGLYSLVGSLIVFVVFLNTIMVGSTGRHYSYAVGKGNPDEVRMWFNAAFGLHSIIGVVLVVVGFPVGEFLIRNVLEIPENRILASLWVFRAALLSAFITITSVAYLAMFNAKQRIAEQAGWGLIQSVLTFVLAYLLRYFNWDLLITYAFGMLAILIVVRAIQVRRAMVLFPECNIRKKELFDRTKVKGILTFGGWNLIGGLGWTSRNQGTALLLNLFFGPKLNAAYGVATQVSTQTNALSNSMMGAFSPEIVASEGRGDRKRVLMLAERGSKFASLLIFLFAIPLSLEMDYILRIWLKSPPEHTAAFCRLVLAALAIDRLSAGGMMAVNAYGKIAWYQITIGGLQMCTLPLAWLLIVLGIDPDYVLVSFVITSIMMTFGRMMWVQQLMGAKVMDWFRRVAVPCLSVAALSVATGYFVKSALDTSTVRLVLVAAVSILTTGAFAYPLVLNAEERQLLRNKLNGVLSKIGVRK